MGMMVPDSASRCLEVPLLQLRTGRQTSLSWRRHGGYVPLHTLRRVPVVILDS